MPCKIIISENTENADNLLIEKSLQVGFKTKNCTKIKQGGYVILDFGKELCGGIAITIRQVFVRNGDCAKC